MHCGGYIVGMSFQAMLTTFIFVGMLEIYIFGPKESGFLDLDPAARLSLESDADLFDEDLTLGTFSLPVDIPWTEKNRRLTGFAERFKNFNNSNEIFFKTMVYDSGFPVLNAAKLKIIGRDGNFSATRGKFSATISGNKGLFGSLIKNKKLTELTLGGKITWTDIDSRTFAEDLMKGHYPQYNYITFVPVAVENFFDTGRSDYDNEFLALDTVNNVIVDAAGPDGWTFGRPKAADGTPATSGTQEYADYRTVPFFRTTFILRNIFEEHGFSVSGEIFDLADYADLATFNNYAIEYYSPGYVDYNRSIFPSNHVPDILIVDWLKALFSFFSIYPVFKGDNQVELIFRKNLLKEKRVFSLNGIAQELFSSSSETEDNGNGYTLNYDWANDDYASDRVKDLKDKTIVATIATYDGLASVNPGRQLTTEDIVFVSAENLYYVVSDATASPVVWEVYSEKLGEYKSGDGDRSVDISMSTLCTYIAEDADTGILERHGYGGCRMTGSYRNNKGVIVKSEFGNKIFFAKRLPNTSGVVVPTSYNHNRDVNNNLLQSFSLAWDGDDGMAKIFHSAWQAIKENLETTKTALVVDRRVMQALQENNLFEINGAHFLLKKKEEEVPMNGVMNVEIVLA